MGLSNEIVYRLPQVTGELAFLARMAERPQTYAFDPPGGGPRSNIVFEPHAVPIHDLRPVATEVSLEREGFALLDAPTGVRDLYDEGALRRDYYREAEQLVTQATGASRVVIFDHTIRRRQEGVADRTAGQPRQPAEHIHADYTEGSGPERLRQVMGKEAGELLDRRYAIVNVWRPIRGPLRDMPLAVCDTTTVRQADLIEQDLIYRDRIGHIYGLNYDPEQRWFYVPEMRREEVLLLKCYDSLRDGRARFMPHTAFRDPTAPEDIPPRESLELRTLAFFDS